MFIGEVTLYGCFTACINYADAVIVHSEQQKDRMMQAGIPEDKIHVVFHGGHQVNLRGLVRTRVTFFGSPEEFKGFFTLLKALRILRDEGIKINLEVYGIYGEEAEQTAKKEARRNNVEDQIQWYGSLSELEFDEKMQESIFTFAIYTEPVWGSSIITRAMMNGTPVIATPLGGSSEYLGDTGMYVPSNDPSALAVCYPLSSREQETTGGSWKNGPTTSASVFILGCHSRKNHSDISVRDRHVKY